MEENDLMYLDLDDLKKLQDLIRKYQFEVQSIRRIESRLETFEEEAKIRVTTKRQKAIAQNLDLISHMDYKSIHKVSGTLDNNQVIKTFYIDNKPLNVEGLDNRGYSKLFFKKPKDALVKAGIYFSLHVILNALGIITQIYIFNLLSMVSVLPIAMNLAKYMTEELNPNLKARISNKKISKLSKRLKKDYELEKVNEDSINEQNQIFLRDRQDIFNVMLQNHQTKLNELTKEISDILNMPVSEEEILATENIIKRGYQKKKSLI